MRNEEDYSTERVSRFRRHSDGDHSLCLYKTCKYRRELEYDNEAHLLGVAVFDELEKAGKDAREFCGDGYFDMRELADAEFPPYEYLPTVPDIVQRIQARSVVRDEN